ncbi:MAG: hypothetical protein JJE51_09960 [Thermoanaerobaculia bacterium]|nr:hypothetical protein [Thermoanaerobaculia bacterium]
MKKVVAALFLFAAPLLAQTSDQITFQRTFLLRNSTGTTFNPGETPRRPHIIERGAWTTFYDGALFLTFSSETGPEDQRNEIFSTNWVGGGAQRALGSRGLVLFRGRASLEPVTVPEKGYPQMLQFISAESGGPLLDSMRAHDLIGEAAMHLAFRTTTASFVHLYTGLVGTPAFGAAPYALRSSSEEFAEAPFAYDVQETMHDSTQVITAGFGSRWIALEASVFHDGVTTGRHTSIDNGDIDSRSARLTITPVRSLALQISRADLGDDEREATSASLTWANDRFAASAIYTTRQTASGEELSAGTAETKIMLGNNTFMARVEAVDRPSGFLGNPAVERTAHFTVGYLYDFFRRYGYRAGAGMNFDYHTQTHDLANRYGHKPQAIYLFARIRTDATRK